MRVLASAIAACLALAAPAGAAVFIDDFESYDVGLNQTSFGANWTVTGGSVDLVGPGLFAGLCEAGSKCVDLDGSTGDAGLFTSISLDLIGGQTYIASYDLAASRRGSTDLLTVNFGSASAMYTLVSTSASDPFNTFALSFTPTTTGTYNLSFQTAGGDNVGPLLDNVLVAVVPEPATWGMMILGFAGMGGVLRLRRQRLALAA